jgi:hypothetical protein
MSLRVRDGQTHISSKQCVEVKSLRGKKRQHCSKCRLFCKSGKSQSMSFAKNYKAGNISLSTHPIMKQFDDPECGSNTFVEMTKTASVLSIH